MFLSIHPKESKTYVRTKACIQMFIVALFILSKVWKKTGYPSVSEGINKLWNIHPDSRISLRIKKK